MKVSATTKVLSVLTVVVMVIASALITGCQPGAGDYGIFDLRSDKPEQTGLHTAADVAGLVVGGSNKAPQANITVRLFSAAKELKRDMLSFPDGSFAFSQVEPGAYLLEAAFASTVFDVATYTILVNPDGSVLPETISLLINPAGYIPSQILVDIFGVVTASDTAVLENDTQVELFRVKNKVVENPAIALAMTQAKGLFLFPQQQPGLYQIIVEKGTRKDIYDLLVKDTGESIPSVPLELVLGD